MNYRNFYFDPCMGPRKLRYYDVLSLTRNASSAEVRRAYRRLALKWHPDKNLCNKSEAEYRFKEITEAYEVLSDPSKRSEYDRLGDAFNTAPPKHTFRSPMEVFQEMFGLDSKVIFDALGTEGSFFEPFSSEKETTTKSRPHSRKRTNFEDLKNTWSDQSRPHFHHKGHPSSASRCKPSHMAVTATKFLDGTTVITKRTVENGCEIIENFEDGKLIARQVDGIAQAIPQACN